MLDRTIIKGETMKGSTLHRSGLTREKMGVLASLTNSDKKQTTRAQLNQYYKTAKAKELDLLWGSVQKGMQKVHNVAKSPTQKTPAVYLTVGFIAGVLFMSCIFLIVSIAAISPKAPANSEPANVAVIGEAQPSKTTPEPVTTEEKYIVKKGDTLNGIAIRFYGRYNEAKINEIQKLNNITNPAALSIGQELIIPVTR